jgi:hypothetical protein
VKLTPEEVVIMKEVRKLMQAAYDDHSNEIRQYICWNILRAVKGKDTKYSGVALEQQMIEAGGIAERLYKHIMWALRGHGVMRSFIEYKTSHLGYEFSLWAGKFDAEARLAWLDRIIEMEDIK